MDRSQAVFLAIDNQKALATGLTLSLPASGHVGDEHRGGSIDHRVVLVLGGECTAQHRPSRPTARGDHVRRQQLLVLLHED
jgi:hypothetical protein